MIAGSQLQGELHYPQTPGRGPASHPPRTRPTPPLVQPWTQGDLLAQTAAEGTKPAISPSDRCIFLTK